jgi:DNA polymerase-3 subunit delta
MIIFLYGPDTYRSRQKLNEIVERYKKIHKSGLNLKYFDFKKDSFEDFRDAFKSSSMFDEKKLLILRNAFLNSDLEEKFVNFIKELAKSKEVIVFYEKEIKKDTPLFKLLIKHGKSQNFQLLEGFRLKNWVKKEFKKYSTEIDDSALNLLLDFVGNNLWQMVNEIRKLVSYKNGKRIKVKDVQTLVRPKIETDIFKTIDAIAQKDKKRALELVKKHLEKGDSPTFILAMINFQFRNLLMIKDLIERGKSKNYILKETGLHPFVVEKTLKLAKRFQLEELKKIHQRIFQTDLKIKTGKITPEVGLEILILGI